MGQQVRCQGVSITGHLSFATMSNFLLSASLRCATVSLLKALYRSKERQWRANHRRILACWRCVGSEDTGPELPCAVERIAVFANRRILLRSDLGPVPASWNQCASGQVSCSKTAHRSGGGCAIRPRPLRTRTNGPARRRSLSDIPSREWTESPDGPATAQNWRRGAKASGRRMRRRE